MILQTLLSVAFIAVIAAAIMTSALANAKVAAHQAASSIATAALARGTDEFVNWAQIYVAKHGAATTWPTTRIVDQPVAMCGLRNAFPPSTGCNAVETISFQISASSVSASLGHDLLTNQQVAVNENRVAGTISAQLTGASGIILAELSTLVTVRIFDAPPFAVLTGDRSVETAAGMALASEGDTGGYDQQLIGHNRATPNPIDPSFDKDTLISTTMSCSNSKQNSNQGYPQLDNHAPGNDSLAWGASGGKAFESPCSPSFPFRPNPVVPTDAVSSVANIYDVGHLRNSLWILSQPSNTWPH